MGDSIERGHGDCCCDACLEEARIRRERAAIEAMPSVEVELVERLESHMGKQDVSVLLADCRQAAATIRTLSARVEELEAGLREWVEMADRGRITSTDPKLLGFAEKSRSLTSKGPEA